MRTRLRTEVGLLWGLLVILAFTAPLGADDAPPSLGAGTDLGEPPPVEARPDACAPLPQPDVGTRSEPAGSPVQAAVQEASRLPECGYGREYAGCCSFGWGMQTRWKCVAYCCLDNQCGLLCEQTWCEGPCLVP